MNYFETSLLRERFSIQDTDGLDRSKPVIALSNRIPCDLRDKDGDIAESFIIRGHNMHSCIRMVARIIQSYTIGGSLLKHSLRFDWSRIWRPVFNDYERVYNKDCWMAVYHEGKVIFEHGGRHPFFDMIERFNHKNSEGYDHSLSLAESAFKKTGKNVIIGYDPNVAFTSTYEQGIMRNGIILRNTGSTTTFNFQVSQSTKDKKVNIPQCLSAAAAYLESVQLCFLISMTTEKINLEIIEEDFDTGKQTREIRQRLARLNTEISNLGDSFNVRYRPERPNLETMMQNAEALAKKILS